MTERQVAELAAALGFDVPEARRPALVAALQAQIAGQGGMAADELEGVEPASVFRPAWSDAGE